jgi:hypothetical protein
VQSGQRADGEEQEARVVAQISTFERRSVNALPYERKMWNGEEMVNQDMGLLIIDDSRRTPRGGRRHGVRSMLNVGRRPTALIANLQAISAARAGTIAFHFSATTRFSVSMHIVTVQVQVN